MLCWLLLSSILLVYSVPGRDSAVTSVRLCGAHLADFLALVCKDRGYHEPYANHRLKRNVGIVDECCKRPCSLRVWQSYCAQPNSSASNSPAESSNVITDSGEGERAQGQHQQQAQVRAEGHRPTTNRSYLVNS